MAIEKVDIRGARQLAKLTQEKMGEICGVSAGTVANWENYRTEMTVSQAKKFSAACGLTYDDIIFMPMDTV